MLDKMTNGLFNLLERKLARISDDFKGELKTYLKNKAKDTSEVEGWKLVYDQTKSQNFINLQKAANAPQSVLQSLGNFFGNSQSKTVSEPISL